MLKQLKSFLKAIWGNIWPTAKLKNVNCMETSDGYSYAYSDHGYIAGCDPFNLNVKSRGSYKYDVLKLYAKYWKGKYHYLPDFLKPQPLSGEVSEQSVILKKMDEIANTFPHPSIKGGLLWNPEHTRVTFVRTDNGRYIMGCDPFGEDYHRSHGERFAIKIPKSIIDDNNERHPYPSDLL